MPLDALNGRTSGSLADYLTSIGVIPVPLGVLEAHKDEQVRRNPPNILFTTKPYVTLGLLTYLGVVVWGASHGLFWLSMAVLFGWGFGLVVTGMFAFSLAIVSLSGNVTFRGPAQWIETNAARGCTLDPSIPPTIREVTEHIRAHLPRAYVIQGDLIQRNEVLDPYLVIQMSTERDNLPWRGERACLGIWDGDHVLHCARLIRD